MNPAARAWSALGAATLLAVVAPVALLWPYEQELPEPHAWPQPTPLPALAVSPTIPVAERMLFETTPAAATDAAASATPPVLLGIARRLRGKAVVVIRLADGEEHNMAVGETVAGWTLIAVGRQDARFSGPAGETVIGFDFVNRQPGASGPVTTNDGNRM